jgi:hypothetical protein
MPMDWGLARDYAARDGYPEGMAVTEAEWLACGEPWSLLAFLGGKASDRKRRLFACACCRRIWCLSSDPDTEWRRAVEIAERYADGAEPLAALRAVRVRDYRSEPEYNPLWSMWPAVASALLPVANAFATARAARVAAHNHALRQPAGVREAFERTGGEQSAQAELLRDILGNPFRPASACDPAWLARKVGAVAQLAQTAYDDRRLPKGTLEMANLVLLADALEDSGCTDTELLGHLRSPGPHVRGCWAVDLVLGKS